MNEWHFHFQPNIFGDINGPAYIPMFTRSTVINGVTLINIVTMTELEGVHPDDWYQYLENVWENYVDDFRKSAN